MLKGLKFVTDVTRPTGSGKAADPLGAAKKKIRDNWKVQQAACGTVAKGRPAMKPDGKALRTNFFQSGGKWYVTLRLGNTRILADGKSDTIEAGATIDDVKQTFVTLIKHLDSGALDEPIQKALDEIKARPRGKRKPKA